MNNNKMSTNNLILIGVVIVVFVAGGWWLLTRDFTSPTGETSGDTAKDEGNRGASAEDISAPSTTTSDGESVSVANQPAGSMVAVSSVTFTETGWIAVRDSGGWTLGAGRFDAGTYENVAVKLLRATEAGERYQILLYHDDGDQQFDLKKESLVTHSDGTVAGVMFTAQ